MRILYALTSMEVGGIEKNLVRLVRELDRRRHDVTVVSGGGELVADLVAEGADHVVAPLNWRAGVRLTSAALALRERLRRGDVDVVHVTSASANLATLLAGAG